MHIALTADVYAAIHKVKQKYPQAPVFVVGFSIGAYTLTKYVGETDSGVWPEGQLLNHDVLMHWLGNVCAAWSVSCCYAKVLQVLSLSKSHL